MRNQKMQEIRQDWKPSRFFFGKSKVIGIGLGRNAEEEVQDDLHKVINRRRKFMSISLNKFLQVSKSLNGQCALLFTDSEKSEVVEWFENFSAEGYARTGFNSTTTIKLSEGPLKQFPHAIEPYLRKLGMPTKLEKGGFESF